MTQNLLAVVLSTLVFVGAAFADVTLTTDQPVYQSGPGSVVIRLTNKTSSDLHLPAGAQWKITNGNDLVYQAVPTQQVFLSAGQSKTFIWNKKNAYGKEVGVGSFTIAVGPFHTAGKEITLSRMIAVTYDGLMAANKIFPLVQGNQWVYQPMGKSSAPMETMTVTKEYMTGDGSLYFVDNLLGKKRQVVLKNLAVKTLDSNSDFRELFWFYRPVGFSYEANFPPQLPQSKLKVGSVNASCATPAGLFKKCYRLEAVGQGSHYGAFWIAPSFGLVQYSKIVAGKTTLYSLRRAKLYTAEIAVGGQYTIGLP